MCALQYVFLVSFPTLCNGLVSFTQQHCLAQQSSQHTWMPHSHLKKKKNLRHAIQFASEGLFLLTLCPPVKDDREYLGGGVNIC